MNPIKGIDTGVDPDTRIQILRAYTDKVTALKDLVDSSTEKGDIALEIAQFQVAVYKSRARLEVLKKGKNLNAIRRGELMFKLQSLKLLREYGKYYDVEFVEKVEAWDDRVGTFYVITNKSLDESVEWKNKTESGVDYVPVSVKESEMGMVLVGSTGDNVPIMMPIANAYLAQKLITSAQYPSASGEMMLTTEIAIAQSEALIYEQQLVNKEAIIDFLQKLSRDLWNIGERKTALWIRKYLETEEVPLGVDISGALGRAWRFIIDKWYIIIPLVFIIFLMVGQGLGWFGVPGIPGLNMIIKAPPG